MGFSCINQYISISGFINNIFPLNNLNFILGEEKIKKVLGDSTKRETVLKKAVATKKKFYKRDFRRDRSRSRSGSRRDRSRSRSPSRKTDRASGSSSRFSGKRKTGGGRGSGSRDSKAKQSKTDSPKKKGMISSCISSWPSFLTSQAMKMILMIYSSSIKTTSPAPYMLNLF